MNHLNKNTLFLNRGNILIFDKLFHTLPAKLQPQPLMLILQPNLKASMLPVSYLNSAELAREINRYSQRKLHSFEKGNYYSILQPQVLQTQPFRLVESLFLRRRLEGSLPDDLGLLAVLLWVVRRNVHVVPALILFIVRNRQLLLRLVVPILVIVFILPALGVPSHLERILRRTVVVHQLRRVVLWRVGGFAGDAVFVRFERCPVLAALDVQLELLLVHSVGLIEWAGHQLLVRVVLPTFEQVFGHCVSLNPVSLFVRTLYQLPISGWCGHFCVDEFHNTFSLWLIYCYTYTGSLCTRLHRSKCEEIFQVWR